MGDRHLGFILASRSNQDNISLDEFFAQHGIFYDISQ